MLGCPPTLVRDLQHSSLGRGFRVRAVSSLQYDEISVSARRAALIILHEHLAPRSLASACQQLRRHTFCPLLVLASPDGPESAATVLAAGADGWLPADAALLEIVARLRSLRRRDSEYSGRQAGHRYEFQGVCLDTEAREVTVHGRRVTLTPKEFELLTVLAAAAGRAVAREQLLAQVWGYGPQISTRTLDVHIGRLRRKIEVDRQQPCIITTVPGVGYRLVPS